MAKRSTFDLTRAVRFFSDNGFISIASSHQGSSQNSSSLHYKYGSNGGLLRHNFLSEWFKANVAGRDRVSMVVPPLISDDSNDIPRASLSEGCKSFYEEICHLHDGRLPFGIASTGTCVNRDPVTKTVLGLSRPREFHECLVQHYVPEKLVSDIFHKIEVDHLMWWKNLSNSKEFQSQRNEESSSLSSSMIYNSAHGDTTTETLNVAGPFEDLPKSPYVIESRVITDIALMTLLHDGYSEIKQDDKEDQRLKFHQRLAPYKLGITFSCEETPDIEEDLRVVADYISQVLKSEGIFIQTETNGSHNSRLQQTGVPYAVVLSQATLSDGVVHLKDLTSSAKEVVHVTQLKHKIMKYVRAS